MKIKKIVVVTLLLGSSLCLYSCTKTTSLSLSASSYGGDYECCLFMGSVRGSGLTAYKYNYGISYGLFPMDNVASGKWRSLTVDSDITLTMKCRLRYTAYNAFNGKETATVASEFTTLTFLIPAGSVFGGCLDAEFPCYSGWTRDTFPKISSEGGAKLQGPSTHSSEDNVRVALSGKITLSEESKSSSASVRLVSQVGPTA